MTLKPKWTSESVGEYERSLKPIEQPMVRTGNCLRVGVCASEGHKIAPQRTWVGLTDEDLYEIYNKSNWDVRQSWDYERAIEAKLKEKNNG